MDAVEDILYLLQLKRTLPKLIACFLLFLFQDVQAQTDAKDCKNLHQGLFYYYSNTGNAIYLREENLQKEVIRETGDTSLWKINWKNDCQYVLTHISGSKSAETIAKSFNSVFEMNVDILSVTSAYYVYSASLRKPKKGAPVTDTLWLIDQPEKLLASTRKEPEFPGGLEAWASYLTGYTAEHNFKLGKSKKEGTCLVQFMVNEDGSVSDVKALTLKGTRLGRFAVDAIRNSPRWIPGTVEASRPNWLKFNL